MKVVKFHCIRTISTLLFPYTIGLIKHYFIQLSVYIKWTLLIEARAVRHFDGVVGAVQGDAQGVAADHANGGGGRNGSQCAVARSRQQQIAVDLIIALQRCVLTGSR